MDHTAHAHLHDRRHVPADSLNRVAFSATTHCLTGCAIGEVLGMVIGTALAWSNAATVALSASAVAFPVNRFMIARGYGHAVVQRYHGHH